MREAKDQNTMPGNEFEVSSIDSAINPAAGIHIPDTAEGTTEFPSVNEFLDVSKINNGRVRVWYGGLPVEFDLALKPNTPMLITFHGAASKVPRLPWFVGYGLSAGLEISTVKFSDSTLYLDESLRVSWYAGSKYQPNLQHVIHKIVEKLSVLIDSSSVIFFGGSGGGYAALEAASAFEGSTAIVFNPTTIISDSNPAAVSKYFKECWDDNPNDDATFDLVERFKTSPVNCTVYYLQNSTDFPHIDRHMRPLLNVLKSDHELYLLFDDWGNGHKPPPTDLLRTVLEYVVYSKDLFSFIKLGFRDTSQNAWMAQLSSIAKKGSLARTLDINDDSVASDQATTFTMPARSAYLEHFDNPAGRNWKITPLSSGGYTVVMPSKQELVVTSASLENNELWEVNFTASISSNRFWLRSCWFAAEIARHGDVKFAIEILNSYHQWLISHDLIPSSVSTTSLDHCLALNLRTCTWMLVVADLDSTQTAQLKALIRDLLLLASKHDRFLWNNHGIMLALAMIHASVAAGTTPPDSHNISRLSQFLFTVFENKISRDGLVRENTSVYQFLWAKWAWEIANTFEYVLRMRTQAIRFAELAFGIAETAALFGIDSRSTLPLGDGNRRSGPAYGPRKGILNGSEDGLLIINNGDGDVFSYSAGSPTAAHRHVDEHSIRLYIAGNEVIADAGFNSFNAKDPVSKCVSSQRGHSGLFFPQFDQLSGSEFYPASAPKKRSHGYLHVFDASLNGTRLSSNRVVDEVFTTHRHLELDMEMRHVKIHDFAHAPAELVNMAPVSRFLIPAALTPDPKNNLRFVGEAVYLEFQVGLKANYKVFHGNYQDLHATDELRGILCPRPGQPENAWVLEIDLVNTFDSSWEHEFSIKFGPETDDPLLT